MISYFENTPIETMESIFNEVFPNKNDIVLTLFTDVDKIDSRKFQESFRNFDNNLANWFHTFEDLDIHQTILHKHYKKEIEYNTLFQKMLLDNNHEEYFNTNICFINPQTHLAISYWDSTVIINCNDIEKLIPFFNQYMSKIPECQIKDFNLLILLNDLNLNHYYQ